MNKARVLVAGQIPPPIHGQSVMLQRLIEAEMTDVTVTHVRMAFSKSNDAVGRFQWGKLVELFAVVFRIWWVRLTQRIDIFYYPPAGPNRIPIYRDIIILLCTRWMFAKTVYHMHASGGSEFKQSMGPIGRFLFDRAYAEPDAVIRLCEHTVDDSTNYRAKREYLVANCAEDEFDRFASPAAHKAADNTAPLQLLYLGTVCETKGILDLLDACSLLKKNQVAFHLHVVGGFQPEVFSADVAAKIAEYQLDESVTLHGQLTGDAKFQRFADADVFCFPTFYPSEGFPCVVLEAMAFQLPVVATRWRGIRSIVKHEETGYLVDIHDTASIASVLEQLDSDLDLRERWSQAGRQQFLAEYTIEKHIENMERVFLDVARDSKTDQVSSAVIAT